MAVAKKIEKVINDEKIVNVIDVFWDGWFNSFKTFQSFQSKVEEKSLQALESQIELFQSAREQLSKLEDESKKLTTEWKANLQEVLSKALSDFGVQDLTEWTEKFEEVGHQAETIVFSPSKKTFETVSESQGQLETALREAIEQQQKNRAEVVNAIGEFVDQLKKTQSNAINTLELNKTLIAK